MRHRRARFLVAPLIAALGLIVLASPAGASSESIGACISEHLEEMITHSDTDHVLRELREESTQDDLEA